MKNKGPPDSATSDRFFHALVIMGGSVALGCGGVATTGKIRDSDGTDASASGGTRSTVTGGLVQATSGGSVSYGGHPQGGSIFVGSGTGGATNTGGVTAFVDGGTTCVPQQWECHTGRETECSNYGVGVVLPRGCGCNAARPTRAADCTPGEVFVCRQAATSLAPDADGAPVVSTLPFECSCVTTPTIPNTPNTPNTPNYCETCFLAFGTFGGGVYECTQPGLDHGIADVLCGCAVVFLH